MNQNNNADDIFIAAKLLAAVHEGMAALAARLDTIDDHIATLDDKLKESGAQSENKVMNTTEAGAYVGRTPGWLEGARHRGDGPNFIKMGRLVRYRRSDLDDWIAENTHRSTTMDDGSNG